MTIARGRGRKFGPRLVYLRDLISVIVQREIQIRYKRSAIGVGWSLLNPLLQLLVFYFVFRWVVPVKLPNFLVFLFVGILVWNWFQSSLIAASAVITDNPMLIRQPGFPVVMLPVVTVTANLVNFLLAFPVLVGALLANGIPFWSAIWTLPLVIATQFMLTLALAYAVAALQVPYRDTQYLLGIALFLGFYLCPVFYTSSAVASAVPPVFNLAYRSNPLVHLMEAYRDVLIAGHAPALIPLAIIAVCSAAMLVVTCVFFVRSSAWFIEEL